MIQIYNGPSYEELKSLLQKLTRLCYGAQALRVANQLMNLRRDYSFTKKCYRFQQPSSLSPLHEYLYCYRFGLREFLHRIMVINVEDGFVHPNYPILGWLMMVEYHCAPHWFPHKVRSFFFIFFFPFLFYSVLRLLSNGEGEEALLICSFSSF